MARKLKYVEAINEAVTQMMEKNHRVIIMGIGVNSPWYVGQSCAGLYEKYGDNFTKYLNWKTVRVEKEK